jgi:TolA-binding protein
MIRWAAATAAAAALLSVCAASASAQSATSADADITERAFLAGNGLLARGLHEAAAAEYRAFLDQHPSHPKASLAHYGLAVALLRSGKHAEAERHLAPLAADATFPYAAEVALMLGQCRFAQGDYSQAAGHFDRVVTQHAGHALALDAAALLAESRYRAADYKAAVRAAAALAERAPDAPTRGRAELFSGLALLQLGDATGAAAVLRSAEQRIDDPALRPHASLALSRALLAAGKPDAAAPILRNLLSADDTAIRLDATLLLADHLHTRGDLNGAQRVLAPAAETVPPGPSRADILLRLARIRFQQDAFDDALGLYNRAAREDPARADQAVYWSVQCHLRAGRPAEARQTLDALLRSSPAGPLAARALLERGILELNAGEADAARHSFEAAATADDADVRPYALLSLAAVLEQTGDTDAATGLYDQLAGDDHTPAPIRAEAHARRALARSRAGDTAAALADIDAALASRPPLAPDLTAALLYERAWCLRRLDRPDDAAAAYRQALRCAPHAPAAAHATLELAQLDTAAGRKEQAAAALRALLDDPGQTDPALLRRVRYRLGALLIETDDTADGIALLTSVLTDPGDLGPAATASAAILCADALIAEARHDEAASFLRPVADNPPDADTGETALLRLADCLAAMHDWPASEAAFAAVLERYPNSDLWFQARFGLGWARENQGRHEEAIEQYRIVTASHNGPTAARAQFQIGECLFALSRHAEAAAELLKVDILYASPQWSPAALYEAGRCFEAIDEIDQARHQYQAVLDRFADTRWADLARQRLMALAASPAPTRR